MSGHFPTGPDERARQAYFEKHDSILKMCDSTVDDPVLGPIFRDAAIAMESLWHSDPAIRIFALQSLSLPWRDSSKLFVAASMCIFDKNDDVVGEAISALLNHPYSHHSPFVIHLLFTFYLSSDRCFDLRRGAMIVILHLLQTSINTILELTAIKDDSEWLDKLNLDAVYSYLQTHPLR